MSMISNLTDRMEDHLRYLKKQYGNGFDYGDEIAMMEEAISTIKDMSAKLYPANVDRSKRYYNGGWIPCEERLPEEKENPITHDGYVYTVTYKNGDIIDIRYYAFCHGHWYHGAGIMDEYVIAWQQVPAPYQPKREYSKS